jgi:phage terminase large subunit-like protein
MKAGTKDILQRWESYKRTVERETNVPNETPAQKKVRVEKLKNNFVEFCKYYFPNFCTAEFASFHKRFAKKVIENDKLYIVRAWAREHSKSVNAGLFLPIYLMVTGKMHNMLLVSHSKDNANELIMPIMINLESNQRLIHDYGRFKSWRGWEVGKFVTADGVSFRSIGAGQSPRGTRNEEKRPDYIVIDDIDTDEESRNQARIDNKWKWIEQALFPTMSISGTKRFVLVGNIISKESIIVKASRVADDFEQINILDKKGQPSWKERYSLSDVNYMLSKISYASGQKEYFNNPLSEGSVFKEMTWGKVPPLSKFKYVVEYTDPSFKDSKKNDFKAKVVVGELEGKFYIIKAYLEQTTTANMIQWSYDIEDWINGHTNIYRYMEANFVQDIFIEEYRKEGVARGHHIAINPDDRHKPDKFSRIEANLEPLNRQGRLILNEAERENPHMRRLEEQFKAIEPSLPSHDDGPDAVEGAVYIINTKLRTMTPIKVGAFSRNRKKY